jgi:hypothetical protein
MKKIKEILEKVLSIVTILYKIVCVFTKKIKKTEIDKNKNQIFNNNIDNSNDTSICDTIRKEKQKQINGLKCLLILSLLFFSGCVNLKLSQPNNEEIIQETFDVHQLKTEDKTYKLSDIQEICVYNKSCKTNYVFGTCWYVVHSDILKTMNENQDLLLEELKKKPKYLKYIIIGCFILFLLVGVLKILKQ